ncbi:hypothetical protein BVX98_05170 [bacterium F11]|nr:hypothetical protein BVX98_05170 [bacterium F11]
MSSSKTGHQPFHFFSANWKIFALLAFLLLTFQVASIIKTHSSTVDEPSLIAVGSYSIKTGKMDLEYWFQPPLMKYLFGLFSLPLFPNLPALPNQTDPFQSYEFGYKYLYQNTVSAQTLLSFARLPVLFLSLFLGWIVFLWGKHWFGIKGGLFSLAAYVLEPNLIAHSGLATTDIGLTLFMFLATFLFMRFIETKEKRFLVLGAVCVGLAVTSKISGIFCVVWFLLLTLFGNPNKKKFPPFKLKDRTVDFLMMMGILTLVVILVYQVRYFPRFFDLFKEMFGINFGEHAWANYVNFFHGEHRPGGWISYFLAAFLIKTPIPFLILVALGISLSKEKKKLLFLLIPIASFFVICSISSKQNGLRYLLPIYPFLCVLIGSLGTIRKPKRLHLGVAALFLWLSIEMVMIYPNYLTYFNQLIGGPKQGYKWFVDCNLDWGQDYPAVKKALDQQAPAEMILATFGPGDRDLHFGKNRQDLLHGGYNYSQNYKHINSLTPKKELLVISASILQGFGLSDPTVFSWLHQRAPLSQPANSTFIYDITNDVESQYKIGMIYSRNRKYNLALRQFHRTTGLRPNEPTPYISKGDVYFELEKWSDAKEAYEQALQKSQKKPQFESLESIIKSKIKQLPVSQI